MRGPKVIGVIQIVFLSLGACGRMGLVLLYQGNAVQAEVEHIVGESLVGPCVVQRCCQVHIAINQN